MIGTGAARLLKSSQSPRHFTSCPQVTATAPSSPAGPHAACRRDGHAVSVHASHAEVQGTPAAGIRHLMPTIHCMGLLTQSIAHPSTPPTIVDRMASLL